MLRKSSIFLVAAFIQLTNGQSLHAGRYYATAPVFSTAPVLNPGPGNAPLGGPCAPPPPPIPVAAPPLVPVPGPFIPPPFAAAPAAAPGLLPAMAPPMAACAPGFGPASAPGFGPAGFGPFGSNKKNERHPVVEEEKPAVDTQPMAEEPVTIDPNAPKVEAKRTVEFADNSTQAMNQAPAQETVTEKPVA